MPPIRQEFDKFQPNEVIWNLYFKPDEVISDDRASRQGGHRDWRNVNAAKIHHWLSCHERKMPDIQIDTDNGLPSEEYKAWYNLVSDPLIHNVANPPKDILQPHNQEEEAEDVVPAYEPQYIMRP
ncbi:hypothetical protein AMTR_s00001p00144390 [Amborella trichopoda]|uniref:Aminotransferase-like plant mobile domain-containing protein n=1 Tax=Amborella trichopoda TaxID=13333 RepID=W1NKC1_AMBTC|nr:hypothetical protein AMTR_s00001p00144390 [Amborella trichopoda]